MSNEMALSGGQSRLTRRRLKATTTTFIRRIRTSNAAVLPPVVARRRARRSPADDRQVPDSVERPPLGSGAEVRTADHTSGDDAWERDRRPDGQVCFCNERNAEASRLPRSDRPQRRGCSHLDNEPPTAPRERKCSRGSSWLPQWNGSTRLEGSRPGEALRVRNRSERRLATRNPTGSGSSFAAAEWQCRAGAVSGVPNWRRGGR
jgi:PAS domain-containing protein